MSKSFETMTLLTLQTMPSMLRVLLILVQITMYRDKIDRDKIDRDKMMDNKEDLMDTDKMIENSKVYSQYVCSQRLQTSQIRRQLPLEVLLLVRAETVCTEVLCLLRLQNLPSREADQLELATDHCKTDFLMPQDHLMGHCLDDLHANATKPFRS